MDARPSAVVADGSKPFLMYLVRLLERMNLSVMPVENAADALEITRVTRPHFMTMDMVMPDMDGLDVLRTLRGEAEFADLPVIMISSFQDKHRQWEALSLGCVDVLDKPIDLRRLHKAIQRCDLYPGGRRRYLRAPYERRVDLHHQGAQLPATSRGLSERGLFVCLPQPLPKGAHVEVALPLPAGGFLRVGGSVIYNTPQPGENPACRSGVAIKFDRMTLHDSQALTALVTDLLIGDIVNEQTEPFVNPHR